MERFFELDAGGQENWLAASVPRPEDTFQHGFVRSLYRPGLSCTNICILCQAGFFLTLKPGVFAPSSSQCKLSCSKWQSTLLGESAQCS